MNNEVISFDGVEAASESSYLEPGMYRLKVDAKETKVLESKKGVAYVSVRFIDEKGGSVIEKFYVNAKTKPRLQYLHESLTSKSITKTFTSFNELAEYIKAVVIKAGAVARPMVVGGKISTDGKFYSGLPYTGFFITDESQFDEGSFEKDSEQYKRVVKVEKPDPNAAATNNAILPGMDNSSYVATDATPWDN